MEGDVFTAFIIGVFAGWFIGMFQAWRIIRETTDEYTDAIRAHYGPIGVVRVLQFILDRKHKK